MCGYDPKFYSGFLTLILAIHPIQAISTNHSQKKGKRREKEGSNLKMKLHGEEHPKFFKVFYIRAGRLLLTKVPLGYKEKCTKEVKKVFL